MTEKALRTVGFSSPPAGFLAAGPLADLHVAHFGAVDYEPYGRAHLVEPVLPGGAGIDVQQVVDGIVDDLQDMRMSGNEKLGVQLLFFATARGS